MNEWPDVVRACTMANLSVEPSSLPEAPAKMYRPTNWFAAIVLCSCWLALADRGSNADDKASATARITELQKNRLAAAKKANDMLVSQLKEGFLPAGGDTSFILRLAEVKKLVLQARLELADTKQERIKVIEDAIKEFEPFVEAYEKRSKAGIGGVVEFQLAQIHLLELKIAMARAKQ
jgi:hypothetical protein